MEGLQLKPNHNLCFLTTLSGIPLNSLYLSIMSAEASTSSGQALQAKQVLYCEGRSTPLSIDEYRLLIESIGYSNTGHSDSIISDRAVCTLPPEYCEFGSHLTKCKAWLQEAHPELYEQYYSEGVPVPLK